MKAVTLVGFGAIGPALYQQVTELASLRAPRISHVVVSSARVDEVQRTLGSGVQVCEQVPHAAELVLECAGHSALTQHILPALLRGTPCAVLSVGALSAPGLAESLADAAAQGKTQLHLLAGAIGGIDAIAAARLAGLSQVTYTGRKPPAGWRGSPAEAVVNLDMLTEPTVILQSSAREAARLYPKNANVAATVSLAGLGLDATQVRLIADPRISENIHEIEVHGVFGQMTLTMRGKPLPGNPKTSALTVLSALRFLHNQVAPVTL